MSTFAAGKAGAQTGGDVAAFGRPLLPAPAPGGASARRQLVLRETLTALSSADKRARFHSLAASNLQRWASEREAREKQGQQGQQSEHGATAAPILELRVMSGDWGDVAAAVTQEFGKTFAVLNMANAYLFGGGYVEGFAAQEENIFRRTDCHFSVGAGELREDNRGTPRRLYQGEVTARLSAYGGAVYLDAARPRVCLRGRENVAAPGDHQAPADLGYAWLREDAVFPFLELRAAAVHIKDPSLYDAAEMQRRVDAQLDTLVAAGVRHAVLGAFGCGAFNNPAAEVAGLYKRAIAQRSEHFDVIVFAIYYAGYGSDANFQHFNTVLSVDDLFCA